MEKPQIVSVEVHNNQTGEPVRMVKVTESFNDPDYNPNAHCPESEPIAKIAELTLPERIQQLAATNDELADLDRKLTEMKSRKTDVTANISATNSSLATVGIEIETASTNFALGRATADEIQAAQAAATELHCSKNAYDSALVAIGKELATLEAERKRIYDLVQLRSRRTWSAIAQAEIKQIAESLHRIYAAYNLAGDKPESLTDLFRKHSYFKDGELSELKQTLGAEYNLP